MPPIQRKLPFNLLKKHKSLREVVRESKLKIDKCPICGKKAKKVILFAKAY